MDEQIYYSWRVVKARTYTAKAGKVLRWKMTEADAERHMRAEGSIIEKVPGSEER